MEQVLSHDDISGLLAELANRPELSADEIDKTWATLLKGDAPSFPEWYYAFRDKKPGFQTPAKGKVSGKIKFKIIDLPDGLSNNSKMTCSDCGSEKISRIVAHANGSRIYLCKRHR